MDEIYWPKLDPQQRHVLLQMRRMTPWQQSFMARLAERLRDDKDGSFAALLEKSQPLIRALSAAGDELALDRWLRRHTIKAVG